MKKILVFCLALCMLFGCGCQSGEKNAEKDVQYVIALNPSVMSEDGTVISVRNSAAAIMSADLKANKTSLYEKTPWQWLTHLEDGDWNRRIVRELSLWVNKNGSPYAYKTDDKGVSSLAVYDSSKMDVKPYSSGELSKSGILMSFTGNGEEAICYTVSEEGLYEFADRNGGKIALIKSVAGVSTETLGNKNAKKAIVLRIYINNRIYWQEVLTVDKTAVDFPNFTNLELCEGDSIIFTAQATDEADDISCGNCDIPAKTVTVTERVPNTEKFEYQTEKPAATEVPFVFLSECPFTFVSPEKMSQVGRETVNKFISSVEKTLDITVQSTFDSDNPARDYMVLIGDTSFKESKDAIAEIKANRNNHGADFIIRAVDNKIVIAATNDISLKFATEFFLKNYCNSEDAVADMKLNYVSSKYNTFKTVSVAGKPIKDFKIVVSRFGSLIDFDAAEYLAEQILLQTGETVDVIRDGEKSGKNEILIGNTQRTSATYSKLSTKSVSNDYLVEVKGGKIIISGGCTAAVNAGVKAFASAMNDQKSFAEGFKLSGKYDDGYTLTDGYKLTWADEFNGTELSKTWAHTSRSNTSVYGGTSYVSKENTYVENGNLVQRLHRDGNDVVEADISSKGANKLLFKYGYLEARVMLAESEGSWGSMWHCGEVGGTYMAEFDAYENFGNLYNVKSNLHVWFGEYHENVLGGGGNILNYAPGTTTPEPYNENYHTIAFEWEPQLIKFYVDGIFTQSFTWDAAVDPQYDCFDKPINILLSHWGGEKADFMANCILPEDFDETFIYYDYIRIYQKADNGAILYVKK